MKARGHAMSLYAAFLVTVGLPLMALCVDGARQRVAAVKLRNATEAACSAYANSLDVEYFKEHGQVRFAKDAFGQMARVFQGAGPDGARLNIQTVNQGRMVWVICSGRAEVKPMIWGFAGEYAVRHQTQAKAKLGSIDNWK